MSPTPQDQAPKTNVHQSGSIAYVYLLTFVAALGGLLFGYDTGVISGAIGYLSEHFQLNSVWKGWATSSVLVGCIFGAALAGMLSDWLGRKKVLLLAGVLFAVSAVGSAVPQNLAQFIIARMLGGFAVGAASMLSPLYIAEVAPARIRGRLVSLNQMAIVFGMLVVFLVNSRIAVLGDPTWNVESGWRWMFGSETLPAVLFFVLLLGVPESPRWLTKQGRHREALTILTRVGGSQSAQEQMVQIKDAIAHEGTSMRQLFQPGIRVALAIAVVLAVLQQITGINVVLYYGPEIFKEAGSKAAESIDFQVLVGVVNTVFLLVAIWLIDKLGRRPLMLITSVGMGVSLALLGLAFYLEQFQGPWVLALVLAYVAAFELGMGPVVWVLMSEIFPTRIRGRAMSIATVCLWIACFLVSATFPWMLETLKGPATFWLYAAMCVVSFLFVSRFVPETKGKTLEEIERSWTR